MLALGGFLICSAVLALAGFATVFRRPDPPRWTTWSGELITLAIVAAFAMGLANLIAGASRAFEEGVSLVDLGLLLAVLVAAVAIGRGLRLRLQPTPASAAPATKSPPSKPAPRAA